MMNIESPSKVNVVKDGCLVLIKIDRCESKTFWSPRKNISLVKYSRSPEAPNSF